MAYIVVSDVHLGSESCNIEEFSDFLKWIKKLENKPETIRYNDKEITIRSPEKFILLGDILELWDPAQGNRDYVIRDSIVPFSLLSDMDCEKIYVIGNHDDSLSELEDYVDFVTLPNGTKFDIWNRHYPDSVRGVEIGCRNYFFLHGHQFDKEQAILSWVSNLTGESWNPLGWFNDLFNVTFTKNHWRMNFLIFLALLLGGIYFWAILLQTSLIATLIWAAFTGFFALSSIPGVVSHTQRGIYNSTKPIDKTAQQVIEDEYYKKNKDTIRADVVIFGHTHFASSYLLDNGEGAKKLFINSGCWTGKDTLIDGKQRYANTFVYIDDSGAYIFTWRSCGKIDCIEAFEKGLP